MYCSVFISSTKLSSNFIKIEFSLVSKCREIHFDNRVLKYYSNRSFIRRFEPSLLYSYSRIHKT